MRRFVSLIVHLQPSLSYCYYSCRFLSSLSLYLPLQ